ncbi:unnamed protein product [Callosobruchus maculatus]|uniref:G-protein coupled receptors family 1 profile domain-containing protein n=1 Tax=Callosobruchus maculatus TaxID=64391 RepID=A0A653DWK0_CALMS|nr:unnamed protein product [Callosobruchus maculatus]
MMEIRLYIQILITIAFLIGVLGNITALWILYKTANRRNKKHLFLLRCLAVNDLITQVGMLHFIYLGRYQGIPYWNCVGFVLIQAFGLGSGCVAFIMAFVRWLALTRPFLYHQVFTYQILKRLLCGLWLTAVILTYLPLFGFGLYYNKDKNECDRFRYAVEVKDKIYAHLFFAFGATLCICIALCNVAVICELLRIRSQQKVLVRRISKAIIVNRDRPGCPARYHTPEEKAFAKLMGFICLIFIVCWAPQVVSMNSYY